MLLLQQHFLRNAADLELRPCQLPHAVAAASLLADESTAVGRLPTAQTMAEAVLAPTDYGDDGGDDDV